MHALYYISVCVCVFGLCQSLTSIVRSLVLCLSHTRPHYQSIPRSLLSLSDRRIPRTVECELTADLVGSCVPGDVVCVCGEVKVTSAVDSARPTKDQTTFLLYILANGLTK